MALIEVKVPPVGESISEVTIGNWLKNEGDAVKMDEVICSLESDKATFELAAEADGILHLKAQEGDVLAIGAVICTIEGGGVASPTPAPAAAQAPTAAPAAEPAQAAAPASTPAPAAETKTIDMKIPTVGESITEVTIASWNKKDGDTVQMDEIVAELESDKATFELPAEASGILKIVAPEGTTLAVGAVVCQILVGGAAAETPAETPAPAPAATNVAPKADVHVSPVAANILAEKGIDPKSVAGSGAGGRVMKDDAVKAVGATNQPAPAVPVAPVAPKTAPVAAAPTPAASTERGQRRVKMTSLRKTIAKRLVAVKNETAMLTTFNEVDMKPVMELRGKYKDKFKEVYGVGLGFMSFFTKAVSIALKEFPVVNAYIDGDEIVYNDACDIAIAVSTERGLVVPVVRNAEKMSFPEIEKEIIRLAGLARENKLTIEQMTGGTFTITNGGIFGSMLSTPIINAPQAAILGMHNIVERAVVVNGEVVVRPIMYLALSYDHRTIDGKDSVGFLVRVKQLLEDPARILLGV